MFCSNKAREAGLLIRLLRRVGVDRAIAWVVVARSWSVLAGPVTILLVGTRLSATEQGYYYTFANILSMAMFFELGLGGWITRFAGYEQARLHWEDGKLVGDADAHQRLAGILRFALRWYAGASLLLFLIVLPAGFFFFHSQAGSEAVDWSIPWGCVVAVSACSMFVSPLFSILEGCGQVAEIAWVGVLRSIFGSVALWGCLLLGLRLLSSPVLNIVSTLISVAYLASRRRFFFGLRGHPYTQPGVASFDWKTELLPLQWRTALTMAAGYLAWQTANPILFKLAGPAAAGRLGMSMNLLATVQGFGLAWINTRIPKMSALFSAGSKGELRRLFRISSAQALLVVGCGGFGLIGAIYALKRLGHPLADRFLPLSSVFVLLIGTLATTLQMSMVTYVRTFKKEPFVLQMIVMGVVMPCTCYVLGRLWGVDGLVFGMSAVNLVFGLLWTAKIVPASTRM